MPYNPTSLRPDLAPQPGESVAGFFLRLGEALAWNSTSKAASTMGVSVGELRWGPRKRQGASARVCGHQLPLKVLDLNHRRICVPCLQENRFLRECWEINLLTTCPVHQVPLVDQCHCGTPLTWADRFLDRCDHCEPATDVAHVQACYPVEFERWLAGRLGLVSDCPSSRWLDGLKLGQSIRLIENVGLLAHETGSQIKPAAPTDPANRNSVLATGYETLQGPAFEEVILRTVEDWQQVSGGRVPRSDLDALGWFGDWFGDEGIAVDHPIHARLTAALAAALGVDAGNSPGAGVMEISILADKLQQPVDVVLELMKSKNSERPPQGLFVSEAFALEILQGYAQSGVHSEAVDDNHPAS